MHLLTGKGEVDVAGAQFESVPLKNSREMRRERERRDRERQLTKETEIVGQHLDPRW